MMYIIEVQCESREFLKSIDLLLNELGWISSGTARRWTGHSMNSEDVGLTVNTLGSQIERLEGNHLISLKISRSL